MKQLGSILKTNVRACKAVGHPFVIQLGRIYLDMLNVYKCLSENISAAIQANGKQRNSMFLLKMGVGSVRHHVSKYIPSRLILLCSFYCLGKRRVIESACSDFVVVIFNIKISLSTC